MQLIFKKIDKILFQLCVKAEVMGGGIRQAL
jgi:hypothetical protein